MILLKVSFFKTYHKKFLLDSTCLPSENISVLLRLPNDPLWQNIKAGSCMTNFWQRPELPAKPSLPAVTLHPGPRPESASMTQEKLRAGDTS